MNTVVYPRLLAAIYVWRERRQRASMTEIPYGWGKICPESGQELRLLPRDEKRRKTTIFPGYRKISYEYSKPFTLNYLITQTFPVHDETKLRLVDFIV